MMRLTSPFANSMVTQAQKMPSVKMFQGAGSGGSSIEQFGQATPFSMTAKLGNYQTAGPEAYQNIMAPVLSQQATQQAQAFRDALGGMRPAMATLEQAKSAPPNQGFMSNSLVGRSAQPSNQGIGGLFSQKMGNQGNQPLQQYGEYLNTTYAMPNIESERQKIAEFIEMVNRAEQAHFGA